MFVNSGAEAVENAIKIARKYTKKTDIICFEGAYYGRTLLTMSLASKAKPLIALDLVLLYQEYIKYHMLIVIDVRMA